MKAGDDNKLLSLGVACVMDLNTLRQQTLASTLATTAKDGATAFGLHACTEAELAFARALGWLVGALHVVKIFKSRIECPNNMIMSTVNIRKYWIRFFTERIDHSSDTRELLIQISQSVCRFETIFITLFAYEKFRLTT